MLRYLYVSYYFIVLLRTWYSRYFIFHILQILIVRIFLILTNKLSAPPPIEKFVFLYFILYKFYSVCCFIFRNVYLSVFTGTRSKVPCFELFKSLKVSQLSRLLTKSKTLQNRLDKKLASFDCINLELCCLSDNFLWQFSFLPFKSYKKFWIKTFRDFNISICIMHRYFY